MKTSIAQYNAMKLSKEKAFPNRFAFFTRNNKWCNQSPFSSLCYNPRPLSFFSICALRSVTNSRSSRTGSSYIAASNNSNQQATRLFHTFVCIERKECDISFGLFVSESQFATSRAAKKKQNMRRFKITFSCVHSSKPR